MLENYKVRGLGSVYIVHYREVVCVRNAGVNISNVIISQSTNQIRPSEIPRSTNYSVSTSPDPPLHVFYSIFFTRVEGLGTRLAGSMGMYTCMWHVHNSIVQGTKAVITATLSC